MPSMIDVVAMYSKKGWHSVDVYDKYETYLVKNAPPAPGCGLVLGYDDIDDLVKKVDELLKIDPDHPCLNSLEIGAHGSPVSINDLGRADVGTWGQKLKTLNWCDEASIYLSACNTGLARAHGPANTRGPIAKMLADAMPFDPASFYNKITVYGAAGFQYDFQINDSARTTAEYSTGSLWWKVEYESYPGARDATGAQSWNSFKNW